MKNFAVVIKNLEKCTMTQILKNSLFATKQRCSGKQITTEFLL